MNFIGRYFFITCFVTHMQIVLLFSDAKEVQEKKKKSQREITCKSETKQESKKEMRSQDSFKRDYTTNRCLFVYFLFLH